MRTWIIYKLTNIVTHKVYIGQTCRSMQKRWDRHCRDHTKRECRHRPLYRAIKRYGPAYFTMVKLHTCLTRDEADRLEKLEIKVHGCRVPEGYNIQPGGRCKFKAHKFTRRLYKKRKLSPAHKRAMAEGLKRYHDTGVHIPKRR